MKAEQHYISSKYIQYIQNLAIYISHLYGYFIATNKVKDMVHILGLECAWLQGSTNESKVLTFRRQHSVIVVLRKFHFLRVSLLFIMLYNPSHVVSCRLATASALNSCTPSSFNNFNLFSQLLISPFI